MKKRIGVIMYQTSKSKGQELVAQRMVRYFTRLGHDAYLITSIYHDGREVATEETMGGKGYTLIHDSELGIPVVRVARLLSKWPPRRIAFKDFVHSLERIVNDFRLNVLITHSTLWNGPEEVAKFIEWRRNIKALGGYQDPIVFCHMSHFQEPSPSRYSLVERSFRMAWNRLSLRTILRFANLILVVSPFEQEQKMKMGAPRERCLLFPGGVDDESFLNFGTVDPEEFKRQRLKLGSEVKIVSYLGTFERRKNAEALLDLAENLKDKTNIHFVLAGRADSEYADELKRKSEGLPNVTCVGEIGEREKVQLIKSSYLNILLSRMEALGLAQLEFMFQGVPVITSAVGGQSWIIRDDREGKHVKGPKDLEGARKAIVELVEDPSKWKKLSANAAERAAPFALSNLIVDLDSAITKELETESGLSSLPPEVRSTLTEPEVVVKAWSHGTQKVVATDRRIFVQQGRLSRSTIEAPFSSIHSIEHIRRYHWRTLAIGAFLSAALFVQRFLFPIISRTVTDALDNLIISLIPPISKVFPQIVLLGIMLPSLVGFIKFGLGARKGFALHGATLKPIFLPQSFGEVIRHVRDIQDHVQQITLPKRVGEEFEAEPNEVE